MRQIRPYQIFTLLDAKPNDRIARAMIPARRGLGGISMLETYLLVAAMRLVQARRVFEFGTFLGTTTFNLAMNLPDGAEVLTIDLDRAPEGRQSAADVPLTEIHLSAEAYDFCGTAAESKIKALRGDSTRFDFSPWKDSVDFVFVDGGHDLRTLASDTENAFRMVAKDRACCIAWHDYGNLAEYPELSPFLDDLSRRKEIIQVGSTMLCFWLNGVAVPASP